MHQAEISDKIIENINELNKILENMDNNQHLYYAGYTSLFLNIDEYGNEDESRTDMAYFIVSNDKDREEKIGNEFFNMMIGNECKAGEFMNAEVDMVEKTIEVSITETSTKYLFNF